jgi:hypothetical protein
MRLRDALDWLRVFLPADRDAPISISVAGRSPREDSARNQLLSLLRRHDLSRWQFTNRVRIHHGVIPHSHPVLTLNTRHLDDDALALSTYLHEQLHWFVWRHPGTRPALAELRQRYPSPPIALPEGAGNLRASELHYLVCYLEFAAMIDVVRPGEARRVIDFLCTDHYTKIYQTVLHDFDAIGDLVRRHALQP